MHISGRLPSLLWLKALRCCQWMWLGCYLQIAMSRTGYIAPFSVSTRTHRAVRTNVQLWCTAEVTRNLNFSACKGFGCEDGGYSLDMNTVTKFVCVCVWVCASTYNILAWNVDDFQLLALKASYLWWMLSPVCICLLRKSDNRKDDSYLTSPLLIFTNHPRCVSVHCKWRCHQNEASPQPSTSWQLHAVHIVRT